jgi:hypothetical protein
MSVHQKKRKEKSIDDVGCFRVTRVRKRLSGPGSSLLPVGAWWSGGVLVLSLSLSRAGALLKLSLVAKKKS